MTPEASTPYDAAIADVQARIQQLQTVLEGLLQLRAQISGAAPLPSPSGNRQASETEVQHDTFFGMTIGDAAKKYLAMMKATKSTAEIAEGLERGGLKHSSKSFTTTVRSILGANESFTRVPNGDWGLTEWYSGMRKERKPKAKPAEEVKAKTRVIEPLPDPNANKPRRAPSKNKNVFAPGSIKSRILEFLKLNPGESFNGETVAEHIRAEVPSTRAGLLGLAAAGLIAKPTVGQFKHLEQVAA